MDAPLKGEDGKYYVNCVTCISLITPTLARFLKDHLSKLEKRLSDLETAHKNRSTTYWRNQMAYTVPFMLLLSLLPGERDLQQFLQSSTYFHLVYECLTHYEKYITDVTSEPYDSGKYHVSH